MSPPFPPIRACLFDMDGLLLNTEDLYTKCASIVLERHGRPPLPWPVKAQMMGVPGSSNGDVFHAWAQLPIPRDQFAREQAEQQRLHFPECQPLPGAQKLLQDLSTARTRPPPSVTNGIANDGGHQVQIALATSSMRETFELKIRNPTASALIDLIPPVHRVLGDDTRLKRGRGKPAPDIYLLALEMINAQLSDSSPPITPQECLVFEDSVLGVEAGRRAGMRVVWVPHPELVREYAGREREVLAGKIGLAGLGVTVEGDEQEARERELQLGLLGEDAAEQLPSLEDFPYEKYGIVVSGLSA